MTARRVRLKDVAAAAGVSVSTASSALTAPRPGGTTRLSEETRERVRRLADSLGYVPSGAARSLATGAADRVAIAVPNLHQPYFRQMVGLLAGLLRERGVMATVVLTEDDPGRELEAALGTAAEGVDGVLLLPHRLDTAALRGRRPRVPVVQVGGAPIGAVPRVAMDEYGGALAVARHLLSSGRRRVAFVAVPETGGGPRLQAYRDAHEEAGFAVDERLIVRDGDWDRAETGLDCVLGLLRAGARPDALLCINDVVALGALRALHAAGIRVPAEVAVTGFDNTAEGWFAVPALTTVEPGLETMARSAVGLLMARISGVEEVEADPAPAELIVRASSA